VSQKAHPVLTIVKYVNRYPQFLEDAYCRKLQKEPVGG